MHFKVNSNNDQYGYRTPAVFVSHIYKKFQIANAVNGNKNDYFDAPVQLNQKYHVEIHQRYISQGDYHYLGKVDGVEIYSKINNDTRMFYNVKIYASDPWYETVISQISSSQIFFEEEV